MTRLLVDTSAYSAWLRGHRGIASELERATEIVFTPVVLGELRAGFVRSKRAARNEAQLVQVLGQGGVAVVDVTADTTHRYAHIMRALRAAGTPMPTNDVWIAASALEHGLEVLTTDTDFERVGGLLVRRHAPRPG